MTPTHFKTLTRATGFLSTIIMIHGAAAHAETKMPVEVVELFRENIFGWMGAVLTCALLSHTPSSLAFTKEEP